MNEQQILAELVKLGLSPQQIAGINSLADRAAASVEPAPGQAGAKVSEEQFVRMSAAERFAYVREFAQGHLK